MKLIHTALLLATGAASTVQAEPLVNIPAGFVIECAPSPSIKWLNERTLYEKGRIVSAHLVTCPVPESQAVPFGSFIVGKQVDGPVAKSYTIQWEMLRFPDGLSLSWSNAKLDQPSTAQGKDGHLRLSFKTSLVANQPGDVHKFRPNKPFIE